ncbi:MAG TPA: hypothetical protein VFZ58_03990 [Candidatus Saccharimonadales bacterium]
MDSGPNAKQQIVDQLKNATNILVTVSNNPSVDELSAALAFTLMLNKLEKHATAVFSGAIPPAIEFLDPEKTFTGAVDSLRDFIIALDKEKADRLRYKVEGEMVKIFITPYRTTITNKDLEFSQGDFNVEIIVALGVEQREALDQAIIAHGRILHDATVITINATAGRNALGSVDWQDPNASSLCEMLMSLSEGLQTGIIDEQIATALLTGVVAATERFSNEHTTPRVMTMSAQLMAAGANQQLIATKLQQGHAIPSINIDGSTNLEENASTKVKKQKRKKPDGEIDIDHTKKAPTSEEIAKEKQADAVEAAEEALAEVSPSNQAPAKKAPTLADLEAEIKKEAETPKQLEEPAVSKPKLEHEGHPSWMGKHIEPPTLGGTLNATTDQAFEDKEREEEEDRNKTILSHNSPPATPETKPIDKAMIKAEAQKLAAEPPQAPTLPSAVKPPAPLPPQVAPTPVEQAVAPNLADQLPPVAEAPAPDHVDNARQAVEAALNAQPFNPSGQPLAASGASQPLNVHSPEPAVSPMSAAPPPVAPTFSAPLPPSLPDMGSLPPMPPLPTSDNTAPSAGPVQPDPYGPPPLQLNGPVPPPEPPSPGQFKIPGQ